MASLIDNLVFQTNTLQKTVLKENFTQQQLLQGLCHSIQNNHEVIYQNKNANNYQCYTKINHQQQKFLLRLTLNKQPFRTKACISLLSDYLFDRIKSKQNQIIMLRQLLKRQSQFPSEANFYISNGNIKMIMSNIFFQIKNIKKSKIYALYSHFINKNLLKFTLILQKYLKIGKGAQKYIFKQIETSTDTQKMLYLSQSLTTLNLNIENSEQIIQYKLLDKYKDQQKYQLQNIQKNIIKDLSLAVLDKSSKFIFKYFYDQQASKWKNHDFLQLFKQSQPKFKRLAQTSPKTQIQIQDYIYNRVKIQIKESYSKPIGEGGFSFIHAAKVCLTFISSQDHSAYSIKGKQHKIQKIVAIKKIKADDKKHKQKIEHQKDIISLLRGSCCPFIPKYYASPQKQDFQNSLVMEFIQGQQLDYFLNNRQTTICLWTKIYILLNVVSAMKHLVRYSIVHLDLKPINILVCKSLLTKVIDFGEAYNKDKCPPNYCPGFTFPYVAPQVYIRYLRNVYKRGVDDLEFSQKQDVFAFGNIMFETIFNTKNFHFSNSRFSRVYTKRDILQSIFMVNQGLQIYEDATIMSSLILLIVRCLDPDPKRRPKFEWIGISLRLILSYFSNN